MKQSNPVELCKRTGSSLLVAFAAVLAIGVFIGYAYGASHREPPTKHKGVSVTKLGVVPVESMIKQTGLEGYVLQLRLITLEPGGQIARHDHSTRPGLVYTLKGSWVEGRLEGEREYPAGEEVALVEDAETDHWFYNRNEEPVQVLVCDLDNR